MDLQLYEIINERYKETTKLKREHYWRKPEYSPHLDKFKNNIVTKYQVS